MPILRPHTVSDYRTQEDKEMNIPLASPAPQPTNDVWVGTSGYSFKDWKGPFYPKGTPSNEMFDYYLKHFPCVEINASYYRILPPYIMAQIGAKAPEGYPIVVKAHKSLTHQRHECDVHLPAWIDSVQPLIDRDQFAGVLAQFPYSFKFSKLNLEHLKRTREALREFPYFAEFRHVSWMRPDVFGFLKEHRINFVSVDEPQLSGLLPPTPVLTGDVLYVRFHGRNADNWWGELGDRYDYRYSLPELTEWLEKIKKVREKARTTYLFFNNCHVGQAVDNAQMMMSLLKERTD